MLSSGGALTVRPTGGAGPRPTAAGSARLPSAVARSPSGCWRAAGAGRGEAALAVRLSVTSGTQASPSSRSTTTGTAAAGATRPETAARSPWVTAEGAWKEGDVEAGRGLGHGDRGQRARRREGEAGSGDHRAAPEPHPPPPLRNGRPGYQTRAMAP